MAILTKDIWERIAFYTLVEPALLWGVVSGDLLTLLCICSETYTALSFRTNSRLYAYLFAFKFDLTAPLRRFGYAEMNTQRLASEFRKRTECLKRVKRAEEFGVEDLWTCFLMLLEGDGKNENQLHAAGLYNYLAEWTFPLSEDPDDTRWSHPFSDPTITALLTWIWYLYSNRRTLEGENSNTRYFLTDIRFHTLLIYGFRLTSVYGDKRSFPLPRCRVHHSVLVTEPETPTSRITHYAQSLTVCAPPVAPAAILAWIGRRRTQVFAQQWVDGLLETRAEQEAQGILRPTLQDVTDWYSIPTTVNEWSKVGVFRGMRYDEDLFAPRRGSRESELMRSSEVFDEECIRVTSCVDVYSAPTSTQVTYTPGSSCGAFGGSYTIPERGEQNALHLAPEVPFPPSSDNFLIEQAMYLDLHEHHSFAVPIDTIESCCAHASQSPSDGATSAAPSSTRMHEDEARFGSEFLDAWLNPDLTVKFRNDGEYVDVFDPATRRSTRYETYYPEGIDGPGSALYHANPSILESSAGHGGRGHRDERRVGDDANGRWNASRSSGASVGLGGDAREECRGCRCVHSQFGSTGVQDILITGTSGGVHDAAWGAFKVIGRVRPWDGLVALCRFPMRQEIDSLRGGRWLFTGYMQNGGRCLAGRWRSVAETELRKAEWEGAFVVSRLEEAV